MCPKATEEGGNKTYILAKPKLDNEKFYPQAVLVSLQDQPYLQLQNKSHYSHRLVNVRNESKL